jgi:hypothetical protein
MSTRKRNALLSSLRTPSSTEHLMFGDWTGFYAVRERRLLATGVDSIEQAAGGGQRRGRQSIAHRQMFQRALRSDRKQYSSPFPDRMGKPFEQPKSTMLGAFRTLLVNLTRQTTPHLAHQLMPAVSGRFPVNIRKNMP